MDHLPGFQLAVSQNKYLSTMDDEMHAVLTVTSSGGPGVAAQGIEIAQVIVIDCSGSMAYPPTKIAAAQRATVAAIRALRDGALFAVIKGTDTARMVYPPAKVLAAATPETRQAAKQAVNTLHANGGTAIGRWLSLALRLLSAHPTAVRHAILLTDGQNNEPHTALEQVLTDCAPVFSCDSRGIGEDWRPRELLRIAAALHGSADAVRSHADLAEDFLAMTRAAMDKMVSEARILVRTTTSAQVDFLRQTHPTESVLDGQDQGQRTMAFSTGSWGSETREFHLRLRVDPADAELNRDIRLARVDLRLRRPGSTEFESAGEPAGVFAHWTDDLKLSSVIDSKVAHYTGHVELNLAIMNGCDAYDGGDRAKAAAEWGRAVALAAQLGNDTVLVRLRRLVEIVGDPGDGVVRIRDTVSGIDVLSAAMSSTMSSISPESPHEPDDDSTVDNVGPGLRCRSCGRGWPAAANFCGECGTPLGEDG